jgi:hypothetical protein
MAAICAKPTAGVDVKRLLRIAAPNVRRRAEKRALPLGELSGSHRVECAGDASDHHSRGAEKGPRSALALLRHHSDPRSASAGAACCPTGGEGQPLRRRLRRAAQQPNSRARSSYAAPTIRRGQARPGSCEDRPETNRETTGARRPSGAGLMAPGRPFRIGWLG